MLEEGTSTNPVPVFVAEGRRRHHAVRLLGATLGLLLAGWLAALATGIVGLAPLPAIPLPGGGSSGAPPATHSDPVVAPKAPAGPSGATDPAIQRQGQPSHESGNARLRAGSSPSMSHAHGTATATSRSSGGATSGSTTPPGASGGGSATPPSGTGTGSTTPPSGTGTSTTPPSGTGGGSQSNAGSEPAWTPPETGTKGADPPRGNSSSAPGTTISATVSGQGNKPSG